MSAVISHFSVEFLELKTNVIAYFISHTKYVKVVLNRITTVETWSLTFIFRKRPQFLRTPCLRKLSEQEGGGWLTVNKGEAANKPWLQDKLDNRDHRDLQENHSYHIKRSKWSSEKLAPLLTVHVLIGGQRCVGRFFKKMFYIRS